MDMYRRKEKKQSWGELRDFSQNSDFYLRRGDARFEAGELLEALGLYRRAFALDTSDPLYHLRMAETYIDMGCYALSNQVLLNMFWYCSDLPEDYYFLLGCNYIGLNRFDLALDCFQKYSSGIEEGNVTDRSEEIASLLSALTEEGEGMFPSEGDVISNGANIMVEHSKRMLSQGRVDEAIAVLQHAIQLDPESMDTKTQLSLAYLANQKYLEASKICEEILEDDPEDIQCLCMRVVIGRKTGNQEMTQQALDILRLANAFDPYDLLCILITVGEAGEDETARQFVKPCLEAMPFDPNALYAAGANAYRLGNMQLAVEYWGMLQKLIPDDIVAKFYLQLALDAQDGKTKRMDISYTFQLPTHEFLETTQRIDRALESGQDYLSALCTNHHRNDLKRSLLWALQTNDERLHLKAIPLLLKAAPSEAEKQLRLFILRDDTTVRSKKAAYNHLYYMGAEQPYTSFTEHGLMEVSIGKEYQSGRLPDSYKKVINLLQNPKGSGNRQIVRQRGLNLWQAFINQTEDNCNLPVIRRPENYAAALNYLARKILELPITQKSARDYYGASESGFRVALSSICNALSQPYEK